MLKLIQLIIIATATFVSSQAVFASSHYSVAKFCFSATNNGTDGVDRFQNKMDKLQAKKEGRDLSECTPVKVYLNVGINGTDGVDRFDEKMRKSRTKNSLKNQERGEPAKVYFNTSNKGTDGVDRFDEKMRKLRTDSSLSSHR